MNPQLVSAAVVAWLAAVAPAADERRAGGDGGGFMRFVEDESGARLQTGVASFRNKDGVTLDLIAPMRSRVTPSLLRKLATPVWSRAPDSSSTKRMNPPPSPPARRSSAAGATAASQATTAAETSCGFME